MVEHEYNKADERMWKTRRNRERHIEKVLTNSDMSLNLLRFLTLSRILSLPHLCRLSQLRKFQLTILPNFGSITLHSLLNMLLVHKLHQGLEKNAKIAHDEALSPGELKANRKCRDHYSPYPDITLWDTTHVLHLEHDVVLSNLTHSQDTS